MGVGGVGLEASWGMGMLRMFRFGMDVVLRGSDWGGGKEMGWG